MKLSVLLICLFQMVIAGQEPFSISREVGPHKTIGQASAVFNEGKGHPHIAVQTNPLRLIGDTSEGIYLSSNFIVQGRQVIEPAAIEFEFMSYSAKRKFASNRTFQIRHGLTLHHTQKLVLSTWGKAADGTFTEVLIAKIPFRTFLGLIKEDSLTFVIGTTQVEVSGANLEALRDLKRVIDSGSTF